MKRLTQAKTNLVTTYTVFNADSKKKLPALDVNNEQSLKKLLDIIYRRETLAYVKKDKRSVPKEAVELKRSLADVLLLLDGFDMQKLKESNKNAEQAA